MSNPSSKWADLRDFCSAIREVVIVLALLSLLVVPSVVRQVLERAGIRSLAGVEFNIEDIAQSRNELDAALAQIDALRSQLSNAQRQVQGLAASTPLDASERVAVDGAPATLRSTGISPSFASVSRLLASMKDQADDTGNTLRRSKKHTDNFLEQAGSNIQLTPPGELFRGRDSPMDSAVHADTDSPIHR